MVEWQPFQLLDKMFTSCPPVFPKASCSIARFCPLVADWLFEKKVAPLVCPDPLLKIVDVDGTNKAWTLTLKQMLRDKCLLPL